MMCELGGLERIVTVELSTARVEALDDYVEKHGLHDVLRPHHGVDQADRKRLASIVDEEFSGAPLDLVIDDASHVYPESRASFETLFPRLRPGGLFLLEDWRWQHTMAARMTCALEESDDFRAKLQRAVVAEGRTAPIRRCHGWRSNWLSPWPFPSTSSRTWRSGPIGRPYVAVPLNWIHEASESTMLPRTISAFLRRSDEPPRPRGSARRSTSGGQAERRRNRTFQPPGYDGLPVLKTGWATRPVPLRAGG